jgi:protein NrfC
LCQLAEREGEVMKESDEADSGPAREAIGRRGFMQWSGSVAVGGLLAPVTWADERVTTIPASQGYLLVDSKKCQGCLSCMVACSLVHEGEANLSRARIQVLQNSFEKWPRDLVIEQCQQCVHPACVDACTTGALTVDKKHGNVRRVDPRRCIGCTLCIRACPFRPERFAVVPEPRQLTGIRVTKCDLCAHAPFHWDKSGGGPNGKQACVEVCPVGAIRFTPHTPEQKPSGYDVNLREKSWGELGYPTD